jgi:hypothetical protein
MMFRLGLEVPTVLPLIQFTKEMDKLGLSVFVFDVS